MHRLEIHATTEEQDASTNPWIDVKDRDSPVDTRGFDKLDSWHNSPSSRTRIEHRRSHSSPGHPLRPSLSFSYGTDEGSGFGTALDLYETRPSLRRAIRAGSERLEGGTETASACELHKGKEEKKDKETEVIVHYIRPGDTLPGVALKYNVSLSALRSANKLWTNDTIHLREQLYIPIHAIPPSASSPSVRSSLDNVIERQADAHLDTEMDSGKTKRAHTISAGVSKVRRVPISELSFFPPPSTPLSSSPSPSRPVASHSSSKQNIPSPPPSSFSRNAATFVLASILNGAKDEIISRLSLDSARPSFEDEPEFELNDVNGFKQSDENAPYIRTFGSVSEVDVIPLEERPSKPQIIRTQQLQPSAAMIIPLPTRIEKATNKIISSRVHSHSH